MTSDSHKNSTTDSDSQSSGENDIIKIIIDDPLTDEQSDEYELDFGSYSHNLANIIKGTKPKFAVGIFGKWGTGKTTLMKSVKS
jgi:predicted KAP-like P-loop ATPase